MMALPPIRSGSGVEQGALKWAKDPEVGRAHLHSCVCDVLLHWTLETLQSRFVHRSIESDS